MITSRRTLNASARILREVLASYFTNETRDLTTLDDAAWSRLVADIHTHRVIGPMMAAFRRNAVRLTDVQLETLDAIHVENLRRSLVIEHMLLDALPRFDEVGARMLLLKGAALTHLDYDDPADRTFEDADVLVEGECIEALLTVLERDGYIRDLPPRTADWDRRFAKDITLVSPWGPELDLHRTLVAGAFGLWIDLGAVHRSAIPFTLAGRSMWAMSDAHRALHAAYALVIGENVSRLSHAFDLAKILSGGVDVTQVFDVAETWGAVGVLTEALRRTADFFGATSLRDEVVLLGRPVEARLQRWARSTYQAEHGSNTMSLLSGVVALPRMTERVDYVHALLWPTAAYRDARRSAGRPQEWRTGLRELARGMRR